MTVKIITATGNHYVEVDREGGTTTMCQERFIAYIAKGRAQGGYLVNDRTFVPLEAVQQIMVDKW